MTLTWSNEPMAMDLIEQRGSGPSPFAAPATLPEATPSPTATPAFEESPRRRAVVRGVDGVRA